MNQWVNASDLLSELKKARKSKQGCVGYKENHLLLFLSTWN